ncbi:MAG: site-specific DNA-methyltransferase, partial [Bacteroidetes bacterium]|nr:site-specific DNA-methyltransferase [Bacteroidota bacterium]
TPFLTCINLIHFFFFDIFKEDRTTIYKKKYPTSILNFRNEHNVGTYKHPTQKPVALMEYLIKTYTNEGDIVFDGFIGSGTTAVACINTNRNYLGFEIDETYVKIAQQRIKEAKMQLKLF